MKKRLLIILPILIALVAFIGVYRYYNNEDATTTLTVVEKKWIEANKDKVVDFEIINDYPLYGMNGSGVFFNFINDFEKNTGIEFNKIPYLKDSTATTDSYKIRILSNNEKLDDKDLLIFTDNYVAVSKTYQRINYIKDMKNMTFGVFKSDSEDISYYLKSAANVSFKSYDDVDGLFSALDNGQVDMIIIPNIMYLDKTINSNYSLNYYFTEINKKVVLTLGENKELNTIVKKYYTKWKNTKYVSEYNEAYLNYYLDSKDISAKAKSSLISKTYTYGYVENAPYEVTSSSKVKGIAGEYINRITRLTDIEFEYKKFSSKKELKKAIKDGKIDVYFDYYNYGDDNYLTTLSTFIEEYVVLGDMNKSNIVNSLESLKDKDITMVEDDSLYNYFKHNSRANIKTVKNIKKIVKGNPNIIVIDREVYNYYRKKLFKNYNVLFTDTMMNDYKFMIKSDNKDFYNLFNYIINTNSYYNYRNSGIESLHASILEDATFERIYTIVLIIIFVPIIVLLLVYLRIKYKNRRRKVAKIDRHKYTDILTSLKNRNYLNDKIAEWGECKIYPQAVVMVDLNNVKYINDNYGHEAGDELIVKAASILVNTQLENSEIIRTDGNEFLIYLVGYSVKQVDTYSKKLYKEMGNLPHDFGAEIGYSIIKDDIKTLDDAINEATIDLISKKEEDRK